jgi:frataxin
VLLGGDFHWASSCHLTTLPDCSLVDKAREQGCATSLSVIGCCISIHTQVAMASRKLLMGLTTRRRLQSRTQQLFWTTSLPEATTSRSLVVAAGTAQLSGRSPAALLFSSRTVSSTQPVTQSAGDVSGSGPSAVDHKFVSRPCSLSTLIH